MIYVLPMQMARFYLNVCSLAPAEIRCKKGKVTRRRIEDSMICVLEIVG